MDTSGNTSSNWSFLAIATPKSSILSAEPSEVGSLDLEIIHESDYSFVIQWNYLPGTNRQTIILELDGQREFARTDYSNRNIRILKRPHREGKILTLKVRAYDLYGLVREEEIDFGF